MFCIFAKTSSRFLVKDAKDEAVSRILFENGEKTKVQGRAL
jgi:hypothetical protein